LLVGLVRSAGPAVTAAESFRGLALGAAMRAFVRHDLAIIVHDEQLAVLPQHQIAGLLIGLNCSLHVWSP
jgi:hypothetical protein